MNAPKAESGDLTIAEIGRLASELKNRDAEHKALKATTDEISAALADCVELLGKVVKTESKNDAPIVRALEAITKTMGEMCKGMAALGQIVVHVEQPQAAADWSQLHIVAGKPGADGSKAYHVVRKQ